MITIKSNIKDVAGLVKSKLDLLSNKEYLLRPLCVDLVAVMPKRIHIQGKASDDGQIGTYSKGYMAIRSGRFGNSPKVSRGPNKGKAKNAGTFTKVKVENIFLKGDFGNRPNYNRGTDTKVIISLTRQLENDWAVVATSKGYGVGFNNSHNFDKSQWVEATYKKKIFAMTSSERQMVTDGISDLVKKALE